MPNELSASGSYCAITARDLCEGTAVPGNPLPPAGWYDDPDGVPDRLRYWDGAQWTQHLSSKRPAPPSARPKPGAFIAPKATLGWVTSVHGDTSERVLAYIPQTEIPSGFMGVLSTGYTLVLTNQRVIFARRAMAGRKQRAVDARDSAKSEGEGRLGQLAAQMDAFLAWDEDRYLAMSPEQVLHETADNFAIERSAITETSFKTSRIRAEGRVVVGIDELLVIKTRDKKYEILLSLGKRQARKALKAAGLE